MNKEADVAYTLDLKSGATQSAILSPVVKDGQKVKVRVYNPADPTDACYVDAWRNGDDFRYMDGPSDYEVSIDFQFVRQQAIDVERD